MGQISGISIKEMEGESNSSVNTFETVEIVETVETHNAQMLANIAKDSPEKNAMGYRASSRDMISLLKKQKAAEKAAKEA